MRRAVEFLSFVVTGVAVLGVFSAYALDERNSGLVAVLLDWLLIETEPRGAWARLSIPGAATFVAAFALVKVRWLVWSLPLGQVRHRVRLAVLLRLVLGLSLAAVAVGLILRLQVRGWPDCFYWDHRDLLSEWCALSFLCLVLACAPPGFLRELSRRPATALLTGPLLACLTGVWGLGDGSWRHQLGWGRIALLGLGIGLGLACTARLLEESGAGRVPPKPARHLGGVALAFACAPLLLSRPWLEFVTRSLGELGVFSTKPLIEALPEVAWLPYWLLQLPGAGGAAALLSLCLFRRLCHSPGSRGDPKLCALVGLCVLGVMLLALPRAITDLAPSYLLVPPILAVIGGIWLLPTLALWALRLHPRSPSRPTSAPKGAGRWRPFRRVPGIMEERLQLRDGVSGWNVPTVSTRPEEP